MQSPVFSRRALLRASLVGGAGSLAPQWARSQVAAAGDGAKFGLLGPVGPQGDAQASPAGNRRWDIEKPGVYENYRIDLGFADVDAVRIKADGAVFKNCELKNGRRDAIEVYADDVRIENCRIENFLAGS